MGLAHTSNRMSRNETTLTVLNNCVRGRWSPMCQYSALTSLRDSHCLSTRHSRKALNTDSRIGGYIFSLPYFGFRTFVPVSVLRFPYF